MKSVRLSKLVAAVAIATTVSTVLPTSALAAWKQDSNGWWNTKGSSYSVGWEKLDGKWYHFKNNGYMSTGWVLDKSTWYHLDQSGAMSTGWLNDNGTWYYLNQSGAMKTGWVNDNGTWYYLSKNHGGMQKEWIKLGDVWYYLDQSGAMKTGFFNVNGKTYFADQSGAMKTLWIEVAGNKYFADASGAIQKGVIKIGEKIYFFNEAGVMQTGKVTIDGVEYEFALTGEAIGTKLPTPTKIFSLAGIDITNTTTTTTEEKSSGGGGGGRSHSSSDTTNNNDPVYEKVQNEYKAALDFKADKVDDGYKVSFTNDIQVVGENDFVTRDLFVVNEDGTTTDLGVSKEGKNEYKITCDAGVKVTAVTRVVREGTVYYLSSDEINLK